MSNIKSSTNLNNLKLNNRPAALFVDGNLLRISETGMGELVFFQINSISGEVVEASGIGTYRMSIEQLEALRATIDGVIKTHKVTPKTAR